MSWGIVLTAHWLSQSVGREKACGAVKDCIDAHVKTKIGKIDVRCILAATARWGRETGPLGLAMSDWRDELAGAVSKVGPFEPFPSKDYDKATVKLFVEGLANQPVGKLVGGSANDLQKVPPDTIPTPAPVAIPASRDKIGESMKAFLCRINEGSICQACFWWGIVLTAHWLANDVGPDEACRIVKAAIEGHLSVPDGIQHVNGMLEETLRWDPLTRPLGFALSDWRESLSPILAKVGEIRQVPNDSKGAEIGLVLAFDNCLKKSRVARQQ